MQRLIVIVIVVHVLAHSLFGCCSHHSHQLANCSANAAESNESHCCATAGERHCSKHSEAHKESRSACSVNQAEAPEGSGPEVESYPPSQHECSHSLCHWVASNVSAPPTQVMLERAPLFCAAATPECFKIGTKHISEYKQPNSAAPPLRLHLAVCVLLI